MAIVESLQPRSGYVPRPRLVARLMRARTPVALIAAPAGYGKTTLAREWAARDGRPFAWVTVGPEHQERRALEAAVERALDAVGPSPLLDRKPFVLVLDDLQECAGSEARGVVRTLARQMPAGSVLALCSRTNPALPIGRLRANRAITEVRTRDLVMTNAEAAMLLDLSGGTPAPSDVELIVGKTEGWPAGIYLASAALRDESDPRSAVARF